MAESFPALPTADWPYLQILVRLALSLSLGLLIGMERERRGKEAGLRTFGFICLLGALGGALGTAFSLLILALVGMLTVLLNVQALRVDSGNRADDVGGDAGNLHGRHSVRAGAYNFAGGSDGDRNCVTRLERRACGLFHGVDGKRVALGASAGYSGDRNLPSVASGYRRPMESD